MGRLRAVTLSMAVLLATVFIMCACRGGTLSDYRAKGFEAEVVLSDGSYDIKAHISVEVPTDTGVRSVRMTFTQPESFSGVTLCENGERYITYKDVRIDAEGMEYLFLWIDMILPEGELRYIGKGSEDGIPTYNTLIGECSIYLDRSTCLPVRIEKESRTVVFEMVETDK